MVEHAIKIWPMGIYSIDFTKKTASKIDRIPTSVRGTITFSAGRASKGS
jgi:hypothetical protein